MGRYGSAKKPSSISIAQLRQIVDLPFHEFDAIIRDLKKGYDIKGCPHMPDHIRGQIGWVKGRLFDLGGGGSDFRMAIELAQWLIDNGAFPVKNSDSPIQRQFLKEILQDHGLTMPEKTML